jgi:hypothetical protein
MGATRARPLTGGVTAVVAITLVAVAVAAVVAVRAALSTDCVPPIVEGTRVDSAVARLAEAGIDGELLDVVRIASDRPQDAVLEQRSTRCGQATELTVSDGGPVVDRDEVPADLRRLLGEGQDPLRLIATGAGPVFKTDSLVVGDCPAVAAAVDQITDPEYDVLCRPPLEDRLESTMADAVRAWRGYWPGDVVDVDGRTVSSYWGTFWSGGTVVEGWRLRVAVRTSLPGAGDGVSASGRDEEQDLNEAALVVVKVEGPTSSDLALLPPDGVSLVDAGPAPIGLTELRSLAGDLMEVATAG